MMTGQVATHYCDAGVGLCAMHAERVPVVGCWTAVDLATTAVVSGLAGFGGLNSFRSLCLPRERSLDSRGDALHDPFFQIHSGQQ
jgi:hypothetical protein